MIDTLDPSALDAFRTELLEAGFEVVDGSGGHDWQGPTPGVLRALGAGERLTIRIHDGWPFRQPSLVTTQLREEHAAHGVICLWRGDDSSLEWLHLTGILARLDEWCSRAESGFRPVDAALDSYVHFSSLAAELVTFDPSLWSSKGLKDGMSGRIDVRRHHRLHLEVTPRAGQGERGMWVYRDEIGLPPENFNELLARLTSAQEREVNKMRGRVAAGTWQTAHVLLLWHHHGSLDALPVRISRQGDATKEEAFVPAPLDEETMLVRAGDQAPALRRKRVTVFGVGAVGSHVSLLLACCGVGSLQLIDGDRMRPTNAIRHAAGLEHVGLPKTMAMSEVIKSHAPFTVVEEVFSSPVEPSSLSKLMTGSDLLVDASGNRLVTEVFSRVAERVGLPLMSVALFRKGAVARTRIQLPGEGLIPIYRRHEIDRFPTIPASPDEENEILEIGCDAPVNRAAPYAVSALAAAATQLATEVLIGAADVADFIQRLRPLDEPGWTEIGQNVIPQS